MADPASAQKNLRSQENLLLDYMQRLEEHREKHKVVRLHISDLKPYNRREHHLRAAENSFSTWYDVDDQYEELLQLIETIIESEEKRKKDTRARMDTRAALKICQREGEPITPEVLARVESALERTDLSNLVRRQFICSVDAQMIPEQSFSEMFISIADLRETMIPGVNLLANRWLFQHLTESLKRHMERADEAPKIRRRFPGSIYLC